MDENVRFYFEARRVWVPVSSVMSWSDLTQALREALPDHVAARGCSGGAPHIWTADQPQSLCGFPLYGFNVNVNDLLWLLLLL